MDEVMIAKARSQPGAEHETTHIQSLGEFLCSSLFARELLRTLQDLRLVAI